VRGAEAAGADWWTDEAAVGLMVMQGQIWWVAAGADEPPTRSDPAPDADGLDCCSKAGLANDGLCWSNAELLEAPWLA
jgi:hypothetical protein